MLKPARNGTPVDPRLVDRRAARETKERFMELYPDMPESVVDAFSMDRLKELIQERLKNPKAAANGKPKAEKKPPGERFRTLGLFWSRGTCEGKLELSQIAVWLRIWEVEGREGPGYASISERQIERDTGLSHRGVQLALSALKKKSMLKTVRQGNLRGDVNRYVMAPYPSQKMLDDKDADYGRQASKPGLLSSPPPGLLVAQTVATEYPIPDRKEEGLPSSSFQKPGPVRPGPSVEAAGPVLPGSQQTNSDGGTIPLDPPSEPKTKTANTRASVARRLQPSSDDKEPFNEEFWVRAQARVWALKGTIKGDPPGQVIENVKKFMFEHGHSETRIQWAEDELLKLFKEAS